MKKISICLLILCLLICGICPVIGSAAKAASVTAKMNYLQNTVDVVYTGTQSYDAYVTVYIAKNGAVLTDFSDIVKVDKAICKSGGTVSFSFECDESMTSSIYNVYAVLSGSAQSVRTVSTSVPVVSMAEREEMLSAINAAPETAVLPSLAVADLIYSRLGIQFEYTEPGAWKNAYIYSIRQEDYEGSFSDISDVDRAWADADKVYAMRQSADAESLAVLVDENGESLGFNLSNSDYTEHKLAFATLLKNELTVDDAKSIADVLDAFKTASALTAINERKVDGKAQALTEYENELGISALHDRIEEAGAVEIARLLDGFKSTDISSVYPKVLSALEEVEDSNNPTETEKGGSGGGSGGGRGGSSYSGVVVPAEVNNSDKGNYVSSSEAGVKKFSDVPTEHWAKAHIEELAAEGIINGYDDGSFRPDNTVSREELVKMIVKTFALSGNSDISFEDVDEGFWATETIGTAVSCGIINGVSENEFGVGMAVSRQDMAVIVDRTLSYLKYELKEGTTEFADSGVISDYAAQAVARLADAGLLSGFEDGTFMPNATLTRAQTAKILSQARKLIQ